jgi:uncharacterized protein
MLTREQAIQLLRDEHTPENVIAHCEAVAREAVKMAGKLMVPVDKQLVEVGALLHDIGRSQSHGINHGHIGGIILRSHGLEKEAKIAERHIGAGITKTEAAKLGLPPREFVPETLEEKVVALADKFIVETHKQTFNEYVAELQDELGSEHPAIERSRELYREITSLMA